VSWQLWACLLLEDQTPQRVSRDIPCKLGVPSLSIDNQSGDTISQAMQRHQQGQLVNFMVSNPPSSVIPSSLSILPTILYCSLDSPFFFTFTL
jgi:hypothetical protein